MHKSQALLKCKKTYIHIYIFIAIINNETNLRFCTCTPYNNNKFKSKGKEER